MKPFYIYWFIHSEIKYATVAQCTQLFRKFCSGNSRAKREKMVKIPKFEFEQTTKSFELVYLFGIAFSVTIKLNSNCSNIVNENVPFVGVWFRKEHINGGAHTRNINCNLISIFKNNCPFLNGKRKRFVCRNCRPNVHFLHSTRRAIFTNWTTENRMERVCEFLIFTIFSCSHCFYLDWITDTFHEIGRTRWIR